MAFDNLKKDASERIIIAAHRGECGGNIPCNTLVSYEIALSHGADMIEVDVTRSIDGTLWILHPGMEKVHLNYHGPEGASSLPELHDDQIRELRYVNYDRAYTQFGLCTFNEVLEQFKGRAYINVDKFWDNPKEISEAIRKYDMTDQVLVKTSPNERNLRMIENFAPDINYMPVCNSSNKDIHFELLKRKINYVGMEVIFPDEKDEIASPEWTERLHSDGKLVWVNAIIYDVRHQLSGGHSDDTAFTVSRDYGWGWLADRGYDIIQTDWTQDLALYLDKTGKRYK